MNCKTTVEMLSAYLDRELPTAERDAIRAHLADCDGCRTEERDLRALKGLLLGVRAPEPAPDFEMRLMSSLREQSPVRPLFEMPRLRPFVWAQIGGLAAAACLAAVVTLHAPAPAQAPRPQAPVIVANNDVTLDVDFQRSDAYYGASDPAAGPPVLMPATMSYGP